MEFKRKRVRGQRKEFRRTWVSDSLYRIVWRRECCGVEVPARYQATVRTLIPNYGDSKTFEMWDFVSNRRLYKTRKAAEEDCEKHRRLWEKACEATGIRGLIDIFGKVPLGYPAWVKNRVSRKVYEVLTRPNTGKYREDECDDLDDRTKTLDCSVGTTEVIPATPIPALCVADEDSLAATPPNAEPATEPVKVRKKRVSKSTKKSSKPTKRKKRTTKGSAKKDAKPSASSPKKKSKRSKS